jgi:hypothetical protein
MANSTRRAGTGQPELERSCLRCLRKAPEQRCATAGELAEALRGFTRDVRYTRNFTPLGTLTFVLAPTYHGVYLALSHVLIALYLRKLGNQLQ